MRKKSILIILLVTVTSAYSGRIFANSVGMGYVNSVYSDGALSVMRNPALMTESRSGYVCTVSGSPYLNQTGDMSLDNAGVMMESTDITIDKYYSLNGSFASLFSGENFSFGFAFTKREGDVYSKLESAVDLYVDSSTSLVVSTDEKKYGAGGLLSFAYRLGDESSFGFQLYGDYAATDKTESTRTYVSGFLNSTETKKVSSKQYAFQPVFGYHVTDTFLPVECGFIVSLGRYQSSNDDLTHDDGSTVVSDTVKNTFKQVEAPSLTLGFLKTVNSFKFSAEGVYFADMSYETDSLEYNSATFIYDKTSVEHLRPIHAVVRCGVEKSLSKSMALSLGAVFDYARTEDNDSTLSVYQHSRSRTGALTFGLDYRFASGSVVTLNSLVYGAQIHSKATSTNTTTIYDIKTYTVASGLLFSSPF